MKGEWRHTEEWVSRLWCSPHTPPWSELQVAFHHAARVNEMLRRFPEVVNTDNPEGVKALIKILQEGADDSHTAHLMGAAAEQLRRLQDQVTEYEASFALRWQSDMRAIKRWQSATGRTTTWPDHTDLSCWLLERLELALTDEALVQWFPEMPLGHPSLHPESKEGCPAGWRLLVGNKAFLMTSHEVAQELAQILNVRKLHEAKGEQGKFQRTVLLRRDGTPIPEDEPWFALRGQDELARLTVRYYRDLCEKEGCTEEHLREIDAQIERLVVFAAEHPERMKKPD